MELYSELPDSHYETLYDDGNSPASSNRDPLFHTFNPRIQQRFYQRQQQWRQQQMRIQAEQSGTDPLTDCSHYDQISHRGSLDRRSSGGSYHSVTDRSPQSRTSPQTERGSDAWNPHKDMGPTRYESRT